MTKYKVQVTVEVEAESVDEAVSKAAADIVRHPQTLKVSTQNRNNRWVTRQYVSPEPADDYNRMMEELV